MSLRKTKAPRESLLYVVLLSLLLLGWGLDDVGGFFAHPARAGYVVLILIGWAIVLFSRLDVDPFRKGTEPVGKWLMGVWAVTGFFLLWFLPFGDRRSLLTFATADGLRYVGMVLYVTGGTLRVVAVAELGKQFSGYVTLQEKHQLVQSGIYGYIRHPMYLGLLLALPGVALAFRSWLVIPVFVFGTLFVLARIRQEEQLLQKHFGDAFNAYCSRTRRLLPYLY